MVQPGHRRGYRVLPAKIDRAVLVALLLTGFFLRVSLSCINFRYF